MKKLVLMCLVLFSISSTYAQIGQLKKLKKLGKKNEKFAPMIYNSTMPVSLDYAYVLNDIELNHKNGILLARFVKVTFPPTEDKKGIIDFETQNRMFMQLTKDGTEVYKKPCVQQNESKICKIFVPNTNCDETRNANNNLTEGKYTMNYFLDDSLFYSINFEVEALESDDAYAEVSKMYMINGPWNKYAYIKIQEEGKRLIFSNFVRHESMETLKKCFYWIDLKKDGKVIASSCKKADKGKKYFSNITCQWKKREDALKFLNADGSMGLDYVSLDNLEDGKYTVVASFNNKEFNYSFIIKGHKIVPEEKQIFDKNNPHQYIESAGKNFFFERK